MSSIVILVLAYVTITLICVTYGIAHTIEVRMKLDAEDKRIAADTALAEAQSKAMTAKPYKELMEALNNICDFVIANEIALVLGEKISRDDRNDVLIDQTAHISMLIQQMLSPEFIRQLAYYVEINSHPETDDYLKYYIRKTVMVKLTVVINSRADVFDQRPAPPAKPTEATTDQ